MIDDQLDHELRRSGWAPDRRVARETIDRWLAGIQGEGFSVFPAGIQVLSEYGGLIVGMRGAGLQAARMVVDFDPTLAFGESDRFQEFERALGYKLFPLGEGDGGHVLLALSDNGDLLCLADEAWRAGGDFRAGLAAIILGLPVELLEGVRPWAG